MPWKKDDNGNLAVDEQGNPVWTTDAGEDKPVDYLALTKRLSEVNAESKSRKDELRKRDERFAKFKDIEDVSSWYDEAAKALEAVRNMSDKEKDLAAQFQARLDAAIAPKDKTIAERDQTIAEQKAVISGMKIQADVMDSKILERIKPETRPFLQRELIRAGALDDDGRIYYRNSKGEPLYGETGSYATREEAPLLLLKELGIDSATALISQNETQGSGALPPNGAGKTGGGKKSFLEMTLEERTAYLKNDANLKQR